MLFKASEFKVGNNDITKTGNEEIFDAVDADEAVKKVLYMRRLTNGNAFVGPTGRVVHSGEFGWSVTKEKA